MDLLYIPVNHEDSADSMDCFYQLSLVTMNKLNCDYFVVKIEYARIPEPPSFNALNPKRVREPSFNI